MVCLLSHHKPTFKSPFGNRPRPFIVDPCLLVLSCIWVWLSCSHMSTLSGRCEYQLDIWTLSYHCSRGFHTDESQRLPLLSFYPFKSSCSHTIVFFISFPRLRLLLNTVAPLVTLPKKGGEKETSLSCSFWTISLLREMYGTTGEGDNGRGERGKRYGRGGRERERILSVI